LFRKEEKIVFLTSVDLVRRLNEVDVAFLVDDLFDRFTCAISEVC